MNELPVPSPDLFVSPLPDGQPLLAVILDAEEEFDWSKPVSAANVSVTSMRHQGAVQRIHEDHGFSPIYVVDYPVASQPGGFSELGEWVHSGVCEVGAQLHTWVNPPFAEKISVQTTYQLNLPSSLEFEKLRVLTETIEKNIGIRPLVHRAGRYGVGASTTECIKRLGYLVDSSVKPGSNYRAEGGPDFRAFTATPFWLDGETRSILEIPVTASIVGAMTRFMRQKNWGDLGNPFVSRVIQSGLARLRMAEQIRLTPEGMQINEAKRLVRALVAAGNRVFTLTYHTPSLMPGSTPYVRNARELESFKDWIREFYQFFLGEIGGRPSTCMEIYRIALSQVRESPTSAPVEIKKPPHHRKSDLRTLKRASAALFRSRNVRDWPVWLGNLHGIKIPRNTIARAKSLPSGGTNVNIILELLDNTRDLSGDIAECGVHAGATLATIALWCQHANSKKHIFGFDSFEALDAAAETGLPCDGFDSARRRVGGSGDVTLRSVHEKIRLLGQQDRVRFVKGNFVATLPAYSKLTFSFVHLDVNVYQSYKECLDFFYPRTAPGGVILLNEYNDPLWPECNKAVDEFLADKPEILELMVRDNCEKYFFKTVR
ncbi:MAG: hypothetical protein EPO08_02405 [Rhodospirillaceae bacterium]|nr:MAG: hypothetical protein EPO08_02405 [Rhodospirillaceae bacterium]